jgi:SOS-response transcriptional repressor LexA
MPENVRPSKKQRELLSFIDGFIAGHGYGPSYREIMRSLNYKSVSTVAIHIDNLITKGHLRKKDHSARSLEVVKTGSSTEVISIEPTKVTKSQEKWLVDRVNQRFDTYEKTPEPKLYDELCILVGALSVLGLEEAAVAAKARLSSLG